jgi:hypothetical protein
MVEAIIEWPLVEQSLKSFVNDYSRKDCLLEIGKNTPVFSPMGQTFASLLLTLIVSSMLLVKAKRSLKLEMMELTRQVLL